MKKIILLGYMGSGKTTIGQILAKRLNLPFLDLDKIIEEKTKLSISDIFEQKGEIYFRKLEHQLFSEIMNEKQSVVLSLGGGTPCYANNYLLLNGDNIVSIYLRASINTLFDRLSSTKTNRPLIAETEETEMKEFIAKHLFDRSFFYNQATFSVDVNDKLKESIIDEILYKLA